MNNPHSEHAVASRSQLEIPIGNTVGTIPIGNIPLSVQRAFKSGVRKHQVYLDGINTLKKEGHLSMLFLYFSSP